MKLAFCLFRYFPYGGIQRDFLRIAEICARRGHELHLFTLRWDGPSPHFPLQLHLLPASAARNHHRYEQFADELDRATSDKQFDLLIGFNKMPHLDVYFCGDPCFLHDAHTRRSRLYRMSGRFRHFSRFERAVFSPEAGVEILLLSKREGERYQRWHNTPDQRLHLLPPSVAADRVNLPARDESRQAIVRERGINPEHRLILMIGSGFRTKGVHRAIRAVASLPPPLRRTSHLLVVGRGRSWRYRLLARRLGIAANVHFLQGRDDVPALLAAADYQLHVSVKENTGGAIAEGLVAGLPMIVTEACGYAEHVQAAGAGFVVAEPFSQQSLNRMLGEMMAAPDDQRRGWRAAALAYAAATDLTSGPERAAELIEQFGNHRQNCPATNRVPVR